MSEKPFSRMLAPAEAIDLDTIIYPQMASFKLDGIRCVFHPTLGMVSRSLKQIPNKQLQKKFAPLLTLAKDMNLILDGEIYCHGKTFQEITRACMTDDFTDIATLKKLEKEYPAPAAYASCLIDSIEYHLFDVLLNIHGNIVPFVERNNVHILSMPFLVKVKQFTVTSKEQVEEMFQSAIQQGYEGLILKNPQGHYKFGRGTVKEGLIYKVKPYIEKSAIIKGVVQATVVDPVAEKKINELGHSVTSKKKDDRILIEKAAAFLVDWEGQDLKVVIAASDVEKEQIWKEQADYIGKEVCFKSMEVGMKEGGLPRHPVSTRFWRKDE